MTLECGFSSTPVDRGCWDRAVQLDLAAAEGVQLELWCENAGPISSFMLYFESGNGWWSLPFSPRQSGRWETITLIKAAARAEGAPGGWDAVRKLRLAAWKGGNVDTRFHVRNLRKVGVLGEDTHLLVARSAEGKDPYAESMTTLLVEAGVRHAVCSEMALDDERLRKTEVVVLPHNPKLPENAEAALARFMERGGRALACFTLAPGLRPAFGVECGKFQPSTREGQFSAIAQVGTGIAGAPPVVRQASWNVNTARPVGGRSEVLAEWRDAQGRPSGFPAVIGSERAIFVTHVLLADDRAAKARLLLAMLGRLRPAFWAEVFESHRSRLDLIGSHADWADARKSLTSTDQPIAEARARATRAEGLRIAAEAAAKQGRHAEALDGIDAALRTMREAYCLAQTAKPDEFRALWCHSATGVRGMSWDQAIQRAKENGFTAIMPNMLWGGVAYYPSEVLPVAEEAREKGDQVAECLAACRRHGLQMHVWKVNWNLGRAVPKSFVEKMRSEGRLQRSITGEEQPWLCPSNPANTELERASLVELARKYAIDGIHFDYIRYPGPDHCFCSPCRERFEKATGKPVTHWPADVRARGVRREEWITWCQGNINTLVQTASEQVKKARPGIQVSAAVFRNWEIDSRSVMQDWKLWCERGWLDFVCPMDYTNNRAGFESWVRTQATQTGSVGLVPGIGASSSASTLSPDAVIDQIEVTRKHGARGFIIFNYGANEADTLLPMLGLGMTKH